MQSAFIKYVLIYYIISPHNTFLTNMLLNYLIKLMEI
jgi:hypothetical protein